MLKIALIHGKSSRASRVIANGSLRFEAITRDVDRSQTYAFEGEPPLPVRNFQATIRVTPVVDGNRAFVEWWTTFDCELERREERIAFFRDA